MAGSTQLIASVEFVVAAELSDVGEVGAVEAPLVAERGSAGGGNGESSRSCPTGAVWLTGWVVMLGGANAGTTRTTATALVTAPTAFATTTR